MSPKHVCVRACVRACVRVFVCVCTRVRAFESFVMLSLLFSILPCPLASLLMFFKTALGTPLLKNPSPDPNKLKNYRPVSNLSLVNEIIQ